MRKKPNKMLQKINTEILKLFKSNSETADSSNELFMAILMSYTTNKKMKTSKLRIECNKTSSGTK